MPSTGTGRPAYRIPSNPRIPAPHGQDTRREYFPESHFPTFTTPAPRTEDSETPLYFKGSAHSRTNLYHTEQYQSFQGLGANSEPLFDEGLIQPDVTSYPRTRFDQHHSSHVQPPLSKQFTSWNAPQHTETSQQWDSHEYFSSPHEPPDIRHHIPEFQSQYPPFHGAQRETYNPNLGSLSANAPAPAYPQDLPTLSSESATNNLTVPTSTTDSEFYDYSQDEFMEYMHLDPSNQDDQLDYVYTGAWHIGRSQAGSSIAFSDDASSLSFDRLDPSLARRSPERKSALDAVREAGLVE